MWTPRQQVQTLATFPHPSYLAVLAPTAWSNLRFERTLFSFWDATGAIWVRSLTYSIRHPEYNFERGRLGLQRACLVDHVDLFAAGGGSETFDLGLLLPRSAAGSKRGDTSHTYLKWGVRKRPVDPWMAVLLCRIGEVIREEMAFELGLSAWVGVYHAEKGGKGTPGKERAYGKTHSLKEWHIQRLVRSSLWLKRRGHVGDEKR